MGRTAHGGRRESRLVTQVRALLAWNGELRMTESRPRTEDEGWWMGWWERKDTPRVETGTNVQLLSAFLKLGSFEHVPESFPEPQLLFA